MYSSHLILHYLISIICIFSITFFSPTISDPRATGTEILCKESPENADSIEMIWKYAVLMGALRDKLATNNSIWHTLDSGEHPTYGFVQCHNDLSHKDCVYCFDQGKEHLRQCLPGNAGRVYLDGCFIRYDQYQFLNESIVNETEITKCGEPKNDLTDPYIQRELIQKRDQAINNVTIKAEESNGFGTASVKNGLESAYVLGQCWETIGTEECSACLRDAGEMLRKCVPSAEARAMHAGCYLRYSTQRFFQCKTYHSGGGDDDNGKPGVSKGVIIAIIVIVSVAVALFSGFGAWLGYKKYSKRKRALKKTDNIPSNVSKSSLHFEYETLEKATEGFNPSNKLGEGGGGSVFKGTLPDGRTVAVKRLFFKTRQWADDFFNEVNLISGIQHKNLVRLLGCSIEGPESLLVYEFVPNHSLNKIIFDKKKTETLSWQKRFEIVLGIAEGLGHLHGGCPSTIIHRDIKNSNILLDENLTPKIADFGLARCVAPDRTHVSTAIAGTLGYMAPEYIVRGQLTEKADVYAFGVLALEIACGRKNNVLWDESTSVLQSVWENYKASKITESVDKGLNGDFQEKEALKVLQVGLLCTQSSPGYRPSMTEVVQMLNNKAENAQIQAPKQPPFLNSSLLASDEAEATMSRNSSSEWHTTATGSP